MTDTDDVTPRRKPGRPADTDSTDTLERILQCARERFATDGFDGTTNKDIAEMAGISSAALYHYFPSKSDMYIAVCESITHDFVGVFERCASVGPTLAARLSALLGEVRRLGAAEPEIVGFIAGISTVVNKHPEVRKGTDGLGIEIRRMIVDLTNSATERDPILQGSDPAAFADFVITMLAGFGRLSARGQQDRHEAAGEYFLRLINAVTKG